MDSPMPRKSKYFHPSRTQPFLITFFQAVMAFKKMSKVMKRRLCVVKVKSTRRKSTFKMEMVKSNMSIADALRGKPVVVTGHHSKPFPNPLAPIGEHDSLTVSGKPPVYPQYQNSNQSQQSVVVRKVNEKLMSDVSKKVNDFYAVVRTGKMQTVSERLQKHLIGSQEQHTLNFHHKKSHGRRAATTSLMPSNDVRNVLVKNDYFQTMSAALIAEEQQLQHAREEASAEAAKDVEYLAGTSIYFGATVSLQARHGGFLSYNSNSLKASAHKIMSNTRFVVKNSEDLTDIGVMKYGDALWLQAGAYQEVLGAQYGSLVDQKREIQPSLISCKRQSMFKAQQYGRWIVLNRDDPVGTMGQPVLHLDRLMLEQEWYFLASYSPYESNMCRWPGNADELYDSNSKRTTSSLAKDLFKPSDECVWKLHLVALPSEDKEDERQRQLLLQQAKDQIDVSEAARWQKSQNLLTSLANGLSEKLSDEAVLANNLRHKRTVFADQRNLYNLYKRLEANGFESLANPTKLLVEVYGADSPIVRLKNQELKAKEQEHNFVHFAPVNSDQRTPMQRADDSYWTAAQKLLVHTKGWSELSTAMDDFYKIDVGKKISAALTLQRYVRRYINAKFDYERSMRRVDRAAKDKLLEKTVARRRLLMEHAATIDLLQKPHGQSSAVTSGGAQRTAAAFRGEHSKNSSPLATPSPVTRRKMLRPKTEAEGLAAHGLGGGSPASGSKKQAGMVAVPVLQDLSRASSKQVFLTAAPYASEASSDRVRSAHPLSRKEEHKLAQAAAAAATALAARPCSAQVAAVGERITSISSGRNVLSASYSDANLRIAYTGRKASSGVGRLNSSRVDSDTSPGRPQTASVALESRAARKERHDEDMWARLGRTEGRNYGLPPDVFEGAVSVDVGTRTGLKFLQAMSANPDLYSNVHARSKKWDNRLRASSAGRASSAKHRRF